MIRVRNNGNFELTLKKFAKKTEDLRDEFRRSRYYERPQEERNRTRRKLIRKKRLLAKLKLQYGLDAEMYIKLV